MKYALGNMLNGAGGLNPDKLALDLQFAADKTLTARKGPTPIFTRASSGTFVGSNGLIQSAGNDVARFDHDPVTLASKGLLIEESRTNLTIRSDDFGASEWNASSQRNLSVAANNIASPSGATDADKLTVGSTTTVYQVLQNTATLTSGTAYSISCFFKAGEITRVGIYTGNPVTLPINGIFELTGSGSIIGTPLGTASIQSFGNGWYRCIATGTAGANSSTTLRISPISGTSGNYPGNGVDSFYAWGAQLEAGSFATSYIPTTTSALTRSADVCSITGANFTNLWNTAGGTFLFEGVLPNAPNLNNRYLLSSGGTRRWAYGNSAGQGGVLETIAAFDGSTTPNYFTNVRLTTKFKLAISVEALACRASFNGSTVISISHNGNLLNSVTLLALCEGSAGTITGVRYYRKNLANAKLQALTV